MKSIPIIYRKKVVGLGFTSSTFKQPGSRITRKMFEKRKNRLLESRLITELRSNDKRSHYYSLTPLGICYLRNNTDFENFPYKKVMRCLKIFSKQETGIDDLDWENITKLLEKESLSILLDSIIKGSVKIYGEESRKLLRITYNVAFDLEVILSEFMFETKIDMVLSGRHGRTHLVELTDHEFHSTIANQLLSLFFYKLLVETKLHEKIHKYLIERSILNDETAILKAFEVKRKIDFIIDRDLKLYHHRLKNLSALSR